MSVEAMFEALEEEEEYVDVWPALRILMRRDDRIRNAVELLERGNVVDAVRLLREAGLEDDQIVYIISTVLHISLHEAEERYRKVGEALRAVGNVASERGRRDGAPSRVLGRVMAQYRYMLQHVSSSHPMLLKREKLSTSANVKTDTYIYPGGMAAG